MTWAIVGLGTNPDDAKVCSGAAALETNNVSNFDRDGYSCQLRAVQGEGESVGDALCEDALLVHGRDAHRQYCGDPVFFPG